MSSIEDVRKRVAEVGKAAAITEEMIRLGFITQEDLAAGKLKESEIKEILDELKPTLTEMGQIQAKLNSIGHIHRYGLVY